MKQRQKKNPETPFVESYAEKAGLTKARKTKRPCVIYMSGAMTDDPFYKLKFSLAEILLKASGHTVINPARITAGDTWESALAADLGILSGLAEVAMVYRRILPDSPFVPAVCLIDPPGRQIASRGVALEKEYAIQHGIKWYVLDDIYWSQCLRDAIAEYQKREREGNGYDGWKHSGV